MYDTAESSERERTGHFHAPRGSAPVEDSLQPRTQTCRGSRPTPLAEAAGERAVFDCALVRRQARRVYG